MSDIVNRLRKYADIAEAGDKPHWAKAMREAAESIANAAQGDEPFGYLHMIPGRMPEFHFRENSHKEMMPVYRRPPAPPADSAQAKNDVNKITAECDEFRLIPGNTAYCQPSAQVLVEALEYYRNPHRWVGFDDGYFRVLKGKQHGNSVAEEALATWRSQHGQE